MMSKDVGEWIMMVVVALEVAMMMMDGAIYE